MTIAKPRTVWSKRTDYSKMTEKEFIESERMRAVPWTTADYEAIRSTATTLIRSHFSHDEPNGDILTCVNGKAFWSLMGALDRTSYDKDDD